MSEELAPSDPLGISRKLLLDESAEPGATGMLRLLGFAHVLSASGVHLYAASLLLSLLLKFVLGRLGLSPRVALATSKTLAGVLWTACWILTGLRMGMLRPLVLVAARSLARTLGFRWQTCVPLFLAIAVDVMQALWLGTPVTDGIGYALAVAGGMAALGGRVGLAFGSWALLALVGAWTSATIAVGTPVLSLLTLPVFSLGIYPLLLMATLPQIWGANEFSYALARVASTGATAWVRGLAVPALAGPDLWVVSKGAILLGAVFAAPSAYLWAVRHPARKLACLLAVALLVGGRQVRRNSWHDSAEGLAHVDQLAVGQGDAALVINAHGSAGLIDTGSAHVQGDRAWIETLAKAGVRRLDWVALTHLDEDHAGGLSQLVRLVPVACVESAREQWQDPRGQRLSAMLAQAGVSPDNWNSGCVPYPTLAPAPHEARGANAAMGAVWIPLEGGGSYLSAGDATAAQEPRIGRWAARLSALARDGPRVLKVSHHGSHTSSAPEFLRAYRPTEAWISVGRGNLYGHPHPDVLARLAALGIPVHRTDDEGELTTEGGDRRQR
jgi:competence protein ComEC